MTKMAAIPIYMCVKTLQEAHTTSGPIIMKLGMKHLGLRPIIVCSLREHLHTHNGLGAKSENLSFVAPPWKRNSIDIMC